MRIGIDARFYGSVGKGLGRYTEKLIEHLEKIALPGDEFVVFLRRENFDDYVPARPMFRKVLADYPWYGFGEQVVFPWILLRERLDLVHFPHFNVPVFYRRPFVVTIHDLILLRYPTTRNTTRSILTYWIKFLAYRFVIARAVRRAKRILTVSHFTEADILKEYPCASGKIVVAYEGCELRNAAPERANHPDGGCPPHGILSPYFLYVGNAYPHKNLEAFIPLAGRFPEVRFVLVGRQDFFYRRLNRKVEAAGVGNIVFRGFVRDDELATLYRDARGYVFPSLYEGFGLPPLEAMRFGTPVVASSRGSLPEVLGDAALFFDPENADELADRVRTILSDEALVRTLSEKGYVRAKMFRWEAMAEASLETYREAVG
ncbi:MAG: glycosyltransferase family 4 protein [Candidatus Moranbacteria bacterium]|nr:glycosyltransferase family 4 protein [Candidatus Moranbacteria bacterium]